MHKNPLNKHTQTISAIRFTVPKANDADRPYILGGKPNPRSNPWLFSRLLNRIEVAVVLPLKVRLIEANERDQLEPKKIIILGRITYAMTVGFIAAAGLFLFLEGVYLYKLTRDINELRNNRAPAVQIAPPMSHRPRSPALPSNLTTHSPQRWV